MSDGKPVPEVLVDGMACGAANALNLISGMIRLEDVNRLLRDVRIEAVT